MLLSDIFEHLNYGELAQLSIGGADEDGIPVTAYPAIVSHLNMGLIELYKRLPLKIKSIQIQEYSSISTYYLQPDFAANSGSAEPIKYLLDSATNQFTGDILKIERVTSSDATEIGNLPLNDNNSDNSLYTPAYDALTAYEPDDSTILTVYYRATPTKIVAAGLDPTTTDIPIPDSVLEALVYFIAARAHTNTPALEGQPNVSSMYLQKFEGSLQRIENAALIENDNTANEKLDSNGWV